MVSVGARKWFWVDHEWFWVGHGFSRDIRNQKLWALAPEVRSSRPVLSFRARFIGEESAPTLAGGYLLLSSTVEAQFGKTTPPHCHSEPVLSREESALWQAKSRFLARYHRASE
jgi:hypothetical protein